MDGPGEILSADTGGARAPQPDPRDLAARLPRDFVVGAATTEPQAGAAADRHDRHEEDLALLDGAGLDGYRFSVSWRRVQPTGSGPADPAGLDVYDRLLDRLLESGIRPSATLFHRGTPPPLEQRGGWASRDTAKRFGEYAALVGERLGDRVVDWVTLTGAARVELDGPRPGVTGPDLEQIRRAGSVARTVLLGHGLAVRALRSVPVRGRIGITQSGPPLTDDPQDPATAGLLGLLQDRLLADPVLLRCRPELPAGLPPGMRRRLRRATRMSRKDLALVGAPIDFYGLDHELPSPVAADPGGLRRTAEDLAGRYGPRLPPVVITEIGAGLPEPVAPDGVVDDQDRVAHLAEHLDVVADLARGDVPGFRLEGYYVRTPRSSYGWVGELQAARGRG
ncbi:Beta-glucosidase A [Nocardioides dokdonensis FR1436]|uniref:Beta-glucosidase A n=1 Tax=Nocardioides dokdonensis FR1436 TaxID=1300347 RepID=A0A1A9GNJ0_9ACTN|nr:family 1 glycosylhydrolase [Nocardioides dokdonensis]ANH39222.1 Beta-glucosidase A [Nocardioides dokdonensis FR1436]